MILAFDTYYFGNKAKTVCLAFEHWPDSGPAGEYSEITDTAEDYVPGEFYKRELPCILELLKKVPQANIEAIIVDGFVYLDDNLKPGLGARLYEKLKVKLPVIGVAKTSFATINTGKREVLRGESSKPLFITAIGIDPDEAAAKIKSMYGAYRVPTLLKQLDTLTKEAIH